MEAVAYPTSHLGEVPDAILENSRVWLGGNRNGQRPAVGGREQSELADEIAARFVRTPPAFEPCCRLLTQSPCLVGRDIAHKGEDGLVARIACRMR
ncbi:Uncharacterised protein [Mycolicibacterium chitae]|uniref:Uncharacterized protein n=1 Tax=Mycolicibacterium chitae TaxID=1792 RepID=A0A448IB23_MYCCI|nr:Uncharacterised protein [Mycolicibacterium chitae]